MVSERAQKTKNNKKYEVQLDFSETGRKSNIFIAGVIYFTNHAARVVTTNHPTSNWCCFAFKWEVCKNVIERKSSDEYNALQFKQLKSWKSRRFDNCSGNCNGNDKDVWLHESINKVAWFWGVWQVRDDPQVIGVYYTSTVIISGLKLLIVAKIVYFFWLDILAFKIIVLILLTLEL